MIIQPDTETLLAVVLGAALATAGGFSERQLERAIHRREKQRSAALLFGELLNSMRIILQFADQARGRGDPYGPITLRLVRATRREAEIYDRNRETLLELRNPDLRARITTLVTRLAFSLDGVTDAAAEVVATQYSVRALDRADPGRTEAEQHIAALRETQKAAFDFALETVTEIPQLLAALTPLAEHNFGVAEAMAPAAPPAAATPRQS